MKVEVYGNTYLVHWRTTPFTPDHGLPSRPITQTTCFIRGLLSDNRKVDVSEGTVREHSADTHNNIVARKMSLAKALQVKRNPAFSKKCRAAFWKKFVETARVTPRSKNEKLQNRIVELEDQNARLQEQFLQLQEVSC